MAITFVVTRFELGFLIHLRHQSVEKGDWLAERLKNRLSLAWARVVPVPFFNGQLIAFLALIAYNHDSAARPTSRRLADHRWPGISRDEAWIFEQWTRSIGFFLNHRRMTDNQPLERCSRCQLRIQTRL